MEYLGNFGIPTRASQATTLAYPRRSLCLKPSSPGVSEPRVDLRDDQTFHAHATQRRPHYDCGSPTQPGSLEYGSDYTIFALAASLQQYLRAANGVTFIEVSRVYLQRGDQLLMPGQLGDGQ